MRAGRSVPVCAAALLAVALAGGHAAAQAEGQREGHEGQAASGEHVDHEAEHGAAEHGAAEHGGHGGRHTPGHINWANFGQTETDEQGVSHPRPPFAASVINFLILAGILYLVVKRAINPALASRRSTIESEIGEAQRLRSEAEAMHRKYTDRLENMDAEFAALREEFVKSGQDEAARIVGEARRRAERMQREGEQMIEHEIRQLRSDLMREAVEAAVASAERTLRAGVTPQDQARLADEYAADLEKSVDAGARA